MIVTDRDGVEWKIVTLRLPLSVVQQVERLARKDEINFTLAVRHILNFGITRARPGLSLQQLLNSDIGERTEDEVGCYGTPRAK